MTNTNKINNNNNGSVMLNKTEQKEEKFWSNMAEKYSKEPIKDEATYQKKLAATRQYFTKAAVYCIYYLAGGVPRLINTLCDHSMLYAYSRNEEIVSIDAVLAIARDRKIGGVNRQTGETEDQSIARTYVMQTTGQDPAMV